MGVGEYGGGGPIIFFPLFSFSSPLFPHLPVSLSRFYSLSYRGPFIPVYLPEYGRGSSRGMGVVWKKLFGNQARFKPHFLRVVPIRNPKCLKFKAEMFRSIGPPLPADRLDNKRPRGPRGGTRSIFLFWIDRGANVVNAGSQGIHHKRSEIRLGWHVSASIPVPR